MYEIPQTIAQSLSRAFYISWVFLYSWVYVYSIDVLEYTFNLDLIMKH